MQPDKISSRKKFLVWGAAVFTSLTAFKLFTRSKDASPIACGKEKETVKMLTQDGKLVEIDKSMLASVSKKITDKELQQWVKNKSAKN